MLRFVWRGARRRANGAALLLLVALLLDDACLGRVFETIAGRNKGAPATRIATSVHEPSAFFSNAPQGRSARPPGYEVIV
jgi:hypothetical protein